MQAPVIVVVESSHKCFSQQVIWPVVPVMIYLDSDDEHVDVGYVDDWTFDGRADKALN